MATNSNFAFKIAAKPLQIKDMVTILTVYKNFSSPYSPTILSPTFCKVRFSHNTCVTDGQTDDGRHIVLRVRTSLRSANKIKV